MVLIIPTKIDGWMSTAGRWRSRQPAGNQVSVDSLLGVSRACNDVSFWHQDNRWPERLSVGKAPSRKLHLYQLDTKIGYPSLLDPVYFVVLSSVHGWARNRAAAPDAEGAHPRKDMASGSRERILLKASGHNSDVSGTKSSRTAAEAVRGISGGRDHHGPP